MSRTLCNLTMTETSLQTTSKMSQPKWRMSFRSTKFLWATSFYLNLNRREIPNMWAWNRKPSLPNSWMLAMRFTQRMKAASKSWNSTIWLVKLRTDIKRTSKFLKGIVLKLSPILTAMIRFEECFNFHKIKFKFQ